MKSVLRALVAVPVAIAALVASPGTAAAEDWVTEQSLWLDAYCQVVPLPHPPPPGMPEVLPFTSIEFCTSAVGVSASVVVSVDSGCFCGTIWLPATGWWVEPAYVRLRTPTGQIYQQYPFAAGGSSVPHICVYTNDPSGPPCLL